MSRSFWFPATTPGVNPVLNGQCADTVGRIFGTPAAVFSGNVYLIERMDDRIWPALEDVWAVDCALALPLPEPDAVVTADSATGAGICLACMIDVPGSGYSSGTTAVVNDPKGSGAVAVATIGPGGSISSVTFGPGGLGYTYPQVVFNDPAGTGTGAVAAVILDMRATFTASAPVFTGAMVGNVIRMGGGVAAITNFIDTQHVKAAITTPITQTIPNSSGVVRPAASGDWSLAVPVSVISGLNHLIGQTVTGLADGNVIPPQLVSATGTITLALPATKVVVGLGFQSQLQTLYLDGGSPTMQGQRKKIAATTARLQASKGIKVGINQPDGSVQSPQQLAPTWTGLDDLPDLGIAPYNSLVKPLYTGDVRIPTGGGIAKPGQVALQQDNPLPMNIVAVIPEFWPGDTPQEQAAPRERNPRQR